jgi:hypothetical protein
MMAQVTIATEEGPMRPQASSVRRLDRSRTPPGSGQFARLEDEPPASTTPAKVAECSNADRRRCE